MVRIMRSDCLHVIGAHIQWIIAQKDSSILFVFQLFTNTLYLVILVRSTNSVAILVFIWSIGLHNFVSLRRLWIARVCSAVLFISDHFLDVSKSHNLLIVHNILKMCCSRQAVFTMNILGIKIWLLFIIELLLLIFAGRSEKYLLEWVHCVTSGCHISLVIVSHRLCWIVVVIWKSLLLSLLIPWVKRRKSVVAHYFWIFFLMIWNCSCLILVCVSHWFMKIADQFIFLGLEIRLPLGLIRLLGLNHVLIFDLRVCLSPMMMCITWLNWGWLLGAILSQSNQ